MTNEILYDKNPIPDIARRKTRKKGINGVAAQSVLIVLLAIILFLTLLPVFITVIMSLKTPQDITAYPIWTFPQSGWAFTNYGSAFNALSVPMLNTLIIDVVSTVTVMLMSCYVAFLFQWFSFKGKRILFLLFIAPMLMPSVILLSPTFIVIKKLGLDASWFGLILPYLAGNQISAVFMLRVFMGQHPKSLYEAAQIDGANKFSLFVYVCLPLAVPIMMVQGIGIFAAIYNDYLWPQLLFANDLSKGTLMPYLKSIAFNFSQGVQYAIDLVAGIPLIVSTVISIKFFVTGDYASGMKL